MSAGKNLGGGVMLAAVVALVLGLGAATPGWAEPSNKWRIVVNHSTPSGGTVVIRVAPIGGEARDITIQIPQGTGENEVARLMTQQIKAALGKGYHVERDDFEAVLVKRRGKTPNFDLTLVTSTLTGTSLKFKRE